MRTEIPKFSSRMLHRWLTQDFSQDIFIVEYRGGVYEVNITAPYAQTEDWRAQVDAQCQWLAKVYQRRVVLKEDTLPQPKKP